MPESLYMLLALAAMLEWPLFNGDIPTAYVWANIPNDLEIFVEHLRGYEDNANSDCQYLEPCGREHWIRN